MLCKALYIVCILTLKFSILLQYLRIFVPTRKGNGIVFWACTLLIVANTIFYIIELFLAILQCNPRESSWNHRIPGTCIGIENIVYTAAFNVASDVIILVLPLNRIWRLNMSLKRKFGVSGIFTTGLL